MPTAAQQRAIQPRSGASPQSGKAPATNGAQNGVQAVVAAYVDGALDANQPRPAAPLVARVGKQARSLLTETDAALVVTAARNCGANAWTDLAVQLQRDALAHKQATRGPMDYVEVAPRQW